MSAERVDVLAVIDADIDARESTLAHLESLHGEDARPVCARISRERIAVAKKARAAIAELLVACAPAASDDGWDDAGYARFKVAFAAVGGDTSALDVHGYVTAKAEDVAIHVLATLGHMPKADDRCRARVVHKHPIGKPPGSGNPPIFCCLKAGHEGPHRCNQGDMSPWFPFRESDEVEFGEPITTCEKCRTAWPCADARAALARVGGAS